MVLVHHLKLDISLFNLSQSIWSTSGYSCSFGTNDIATNLCIYKLCCLLFFHNLTFLYPAPAIQNDTIYYFSSKTFEDCLDEHGPHFSKKLCELAVSCMENADGSKHRYSKEEVKELLKRNGVTVKKASEYDCCFVANMAYADFFPEPLRNEFDIAMYVKKYIDDPDGYDGIAFSRYLADLKRTGKYIDWEEMI